MKNLPLVTAILAIASAGAENTRSTCGGTLVKEFSSEKSLEFNLKEVTAEILSGEFDTFEEMHEPPNPGEECESNAEEFHYRCTQMVDLIIESFRSFIDETRFDVWRFEAQGQNLLKRLRHIENITHDNSDTLFVSKLNFAGYMFRIMGEAIELMKHYENVRTAGHGIVWSIIDLNVRLLTLFRTNGTPKVETENFAINVYVYSQHLLFLKSGFEKYEGVPFGTQVVFNAQLVRAEYTLKLLAENGSSEVEI